MAAVAGEGGGTYTYSSQPHALSSRQNKYKQIMDEAEEDDPNYGNIMYDRRVIRGNTYAIQRSLYQLQAEVAKKLEENDKRRMLLREKLEKRKHKKEAIEEEDLSEQEASEAAMEPQYELIPADPDDLIYEKGWYDPHLPRPVSPPYVKATSLLDASTQIEPDDLFDFDDEVRPVLEVFVGVTVEQALLEVDEEEELFKMREQRRMFEELRNTELAEQQRLQDQHRRLTEEKERRKKQHEKAMKERAELQTKIAALVFSQNYVHDLIPTVFGSLAQNGYFYDPVERQVEDIYLPYLVDQAMEEVAKQLRARAVLDTLLRDAMLLHSAQTGNMAELRESEAHRKAQREREQAVQEADKQQDSAARAFRAARKSPKQREGAPQHETIPEEPSDLVDAEEHDDTADREEQVNKIPPQIPEDDSEQEAASDEAADVPADALAEAAQLAEAADVTTSLQADGEPQVQPENLPAEDA